MNETPRKVTQAEFDAITCNRCGQCCQHLYHMGPLELAMEIGRWADWAPEKSVRRWTDQEYVDAGIDLQALEEHRRWLRWISCLKPNGDSYVMDGYPEPRYEYSCDRLALVDGVYTCTAYDDRPLACRNFPYAQPVSAIPECAWFVSIEEVDG